MKDWYKNLYRGQRYLVNAGIVLFIITCILWCTRDYPDRPRPKYIILGIK